MLSASSAFAQEADSLQASHVVSVRYVPITRPSETVPLYREVSVPPVADILRSFTGVQVKDYGGVGGLKTVNVRSLGSEHVAIFLDGIQVENAQNMQVDLGRFASDNLGFVSLYHGQQSDLLQSAKEYSGATAVYLTSSCPFLIDKAPHLRFRLKGGSFGTVSPAVRMDKNVGKTVVSASAEYLRSNGRYPYTYLDTTLTRENGDIRSVRAETQVWGQSRKGHWTARAYGYGSDRGFPGPVVRRAEGFPFSAERQQDLDLFLQGTWKSWWSDLYATALRFKLADSRTHYATHPEKNPMAVPYDSHFHQRSGYISVSQSFTPFKPISFDLASDLQFNRLHADIAQFVEPSRWTLIQAAAVRWATRKATLSASVSWQGAWDRFDHPEAGGWSRENTFRNAWTPCFTAYWRPLHGLDVQAFVKRSWRLPSFNDLYYTLVGNAGLSPESAIQSGLALQWTGRKDRFVWEVQLEPYFNRVLDKIVALPTVSQFRWSMMNIGRVDVTGADLKLSGTWELSLVNLSLTGRYSFQQALDHTDRESILYGNQIPYIPLHSGSLTARVDFWDEWVLLWTTSSTGERWSRTANTPDYHIDPYVLSDLQLSTRQEFWIRDKVTYLVVAVSVNNLLNTQYQVVQGYPMPGRNGMLTVQYEF